jgi:hypothetical protein
LDCGPEREDEREMDRRGIPQVKQTGSLLKPAAVLTCEFDATPEVGFSMVRNEVGRVWRDAQQARGFLFLFQFVSI